MSAASGRKHHMNFDDVKKAFQKLSHTAVSIDGVLSVSTKTYAEFEAALEAHDCLRDGSVEPTPEELAEEARVESMSKEELTLYLARNGISPEDSARSLGEMMRMVKLIKTLTNTPLPMILVCPTCKVQHVDRLEKTGIDWAKRVHRTHLCKKEEGGCGALFRPSNHPTVGVEKLPEIA